MKEKKVAMKISGFRVANKQVAYIFLAISRAEPLATQLFIKKCVGLPDSI